MYYKTVPKCPAAAVAVSCSCLAWEVKSATSSRTGRRGRRPGASSMPAGRYAELPADEDSSARPQRSDEIIEHDGHRLHACCRGGRGGCGRRHVICWLCFVSGSILQAQRTALPIAMVRMQSTFGWDKALQGQLLSAFFLGYFLMQLPGGVIATRCCSPSLLIGGSVAMASLLTLLIPTAAISAPYLLYASRVAQGAAQGPWSSALATLWSRWSPPDERSQMDSLPQVGQFAGTLLFGSLTGLQCDHPEWGFGVFGGWQGVFHLHGLLGLLWAVLWFAVIKAADEPASDRRCSDAEREYIEAALAAEVASCVQNQADAVDDASNPQSAKLSLYSAADSEDTDEREAASAGRSAAGSTAGSTAGAGAGAGLSNMGLAIEILCSGPVWAIVIVQSFSSFTAFILDDGLPSYMRDVAGLTLTQAGTYTYTVHSHSHALTLRT
jgi:MFS family permease